MANKITLADGQAKKVDLEDNLDQAVADIAKNSTESVIEETENEEKNTKKLISKIISKVQEETTKKVLSLVSKDLEKYNNIIANDLEDEKINDDMSKVVKRVQEETTKKVLSLVSKDLEKYNMLIAKDSTELNDMFDEEVKNTINKIVEGYESKISKLASISKTYKRIAEEKDNSIDADKLIDDMTKTMEENIAKVFGKSNLARFKKYLEAKANGEFDELDDAFDYHKISEEEFIKVSKKDGVAYEVDELEKAKIQRILEEEENEKIDLEGIESLEDAIAKVKELAEEARALKETVDNFISNVDAEEEAEESNDEEAEDVEVSNDEEVEAEESNEDEEAEDKSIDDIINDEDDLEGFDVDALDELNDFTLEDKQDIEKLLINGKITSVNKLKRIVESRIFLNKKNK